MMFFFSTLQVIQEFINETSVSRTGDSISENTLSFVWSFAVAIFAIGGMIGGLVAGTAADKLGRYIADRPTSKKSLIKEV